MSFPLTDNKGSIRARIASPLFWKQINEHFGVDGGVYVLSSTGSADREKSLPVNRLLGTDHEGVLYIGMGMSFLDRAIQLKKSLSPEHVSRGHECGARYKDHPAISMAFPYESLVLTLIRAGDPRAAESKMIQEYMQKFGELPPLNRVC